MKGFRKTKATISIKYITSTAIMFKYHNRTELLRLSEFFRSFWAYKTVF